MHIYYLKGFKSFDNYRKSLKCQKKNEFGRDILQTVKQEVI